MKTRSPWLMFIVILITAICFAIGQFKVPPTLVAISMDPAWHTDLVQGGLLMSIVAITAIILALFGGMLTVRFKPKTLAVFALCCAIVGNIVGYVAPSFGVLLFSRLIEGLGYGMQTAVMPTLISEIFPEDKRRVPMALYSIWVSIGMLIIFNGAAIITGGFVDWKATWLFCAVMFVIILVIFFLVVKEPEDSALGQGASTSISEQMKEIGVEARNPSTWSLTLVFTIFGLGCSAFSTFAPTFCVEALGMDMVVANGATSFLTIGMLAGGFIMSGILGVYKGSRPMLMLIVTIITGVFFTISFLIPTPVLVIPFCIVFGIVLQTIPPTTFAVAPETAISPKTVGMALGIATAGDHLGAFIGTVFLGAVVQSAGGNWLMAVPVMGAFALIGIIGAIWYLVSMKKHAERQARFEASQQA